MSNYFTDSKHFISFFLNIYAIININKLYKKNIKNL